MKFSHIAIAWFAAAWLVPLIAATAYVAITHVAGSGSPRAQLITLAVTVLIGALCAYRSGLAVGWRHVGASLAAISYLAVAIVAVPLYGLTFSCIIYRDCL
jgi:hypothetical protein